ncbi:hypothetical protein D3C86_2079240 [compost metagenome]
MVLCTIEDEGGLHHIAYRLAFQLEAQAHTAIGVEHISQLAELVDRRQKVRVET